MFLLEYIDPIVFLVSLCLGLFYTYLTTPYPKVVIKYPTPYNAGKITYVDDAQVCYRYQVKEVPCPEDQNRIRTLPLQ